jgi:hypothetical protein
VFQVREIYSKFRMAPYETTQHSIACTPAASMIASAIYARVSPTRHKQNSKMPSQTYRRHSANTPCASRTRP